MIESLTLSNFVIVQYETLSFNTGFSVLSGETGAGKSILIDAVKFALGAKASQSLLKDPTTPASVTLEITGSSPLYDLCNNLGAGLATDDTTAPLILKRLLTPDGKTKAFINAQPTSAQFLKALAPHIIHFHSQFEDITSYQSQKEMIEEFGGLREMREQTSAAFIKWKQAVDSLSERLQEQARLEAERTYITESIEEIQAFAPLENEETLLLEKRKSLQSLKADRQHLQMADSLLNEEPRLSQRLQEIARHLSKLPESLAEAALPLADSLIDQTQLLEQHVQAIAYEMDAPEEDPDQIEARLFALRALARKHQIAPDELPGLYQRLQEQATLLKNAGTTVQDAEHAVQATREAYITSAQALAAGRLSTTEMLCAQVTAELPALKMEKAALKAHQDIDAEPQWTGDGIDRTEIYVRTNPGAPYASLKACASGGELSRIMLSLKVITGPLKDAATFIFDEIDKGLGGAVATAVGRRLKRLAQHHQVLSITHAPQVAALADYHWYIQKTQHETATESSVTLLETGADRTEEIARMLAGEHITPEARAAATQLLEEGKQP